jgi:penicillin-binding protein 1A
VFSIGVFSFVSIFLAAGFGLLGKMPEFRQLENPKTNLATQIYSSDNKGHWEVLLQRQSNAFVL